MPLHRTLLLGLGNTCHETATACVGEACFR